MTGYLIALGSNLPSGQYDSVAILNEALEQLARLQGITVDRVSGWFRTPAWPAGSGPDFVNGAALLRSSNTPQEILKTLHRVEAGFGRERRVRWGARTCDLDLIGAEDAVLPNLETLTAWINHGPDPERVPEDLLLPHPRLHERGFVLVPLHEVAPDWVHPVLHLTVAEMMSALPDAEIEAVQRL